MAGRHGGPDAVGSPTPNPLYSYPRTLPRLLQEGNFGFLRQAAKRSSNPAGRIIQENPGCVDLVTGHSFGLLSVLSTDFTELRYAGGTRKAWFMATVDITGKRAPGWVVGRARNRDLARECWQRTCQSLKDIGRSTEGVIVHQDQDSVYTSYDWLRLLLVGSGPSVLLQEWGQGQSLGPVHMEPC